MRAFHTIAPLTLALASAGCQVILGLERPQLIEDAGIDGSGQDADGWNGMGVDPNGEHFQYVLDSAQLPDASGNPGLDIDGDGAVDNQLGALFAVVDSAGLGLQAKVDEAVAAGSTILLADVQATDLAAAAGVGVLVFLGANPDPAPPDHLSGGATFNITSDSPRDALLVGEIAGGRFTGGPGEVSLELAIAGAALRLNLIGAQMEVNASEGGLMSGILGGAVTKDELNTNILPALATQLNSIVDGDPSCTATSGTPEECCSEEGTGRTVLTLFGDADNNCMISVAEIQGSTTLQGFLAPDVDLVDDDDVDDSLSFGMGFTAVGAQFEL